ncbi:uncharacterized protein LOC132695756 [Cylas formicarius]|uniref:uncharacterized protein LOC132695756 n=1 Tax=Cylas formicarius TaxID=197179 RepID=UPI0029584EC7|nr:uncharacterized protein LOC132695756 [Cylas formicarius]
MGHNEKTHSEFYRLPDDVYQTAKVSKLLLLSQNSALFEKNKGKPLSEIELNDEIIDESDDNYLEDIYENVLENQNPNQLKNQDQVPAFGVADIPREKKRKRKLVPWTNDQKKITECFFKKHIKNKIPPKKQEVMRLIESDPRIFTNKTWPVIKVYICNKFNKK